MVREIQLLTDYPAAPQKDWAGYFHKKDITLQNPNSLTGGSVNCFIPDNDMIVPRAGSLLVGEPWIVGIKNWPCIGHAKKFTNITGEKLEVRVTKSDDQRQDLFEVLVTLDKQTITYSNPTGSFISESITGALSGAVAYIVFTLNAGEMDVDFVVDGPFLVGETITGSSSGATGKITALGPLIRHYKWYQISETANPIIRGHEWYFDEWWDKDSNLKGGELPRLIGVNGNIARQIISWTGSFTQIVSKTPTSLKTNTTWAERGFLDPANGGSGKILVNGVIYTVLAGWNTDTIFIASTALINVSDMAFDPIRIDSPNGSGVFDFCKTVKNHVNYGDWDQRSVFASNAFNVLADIAITGTTAILNDLVLTGYYTGLTNKTLTFKIDSIAPNDQFISTNVSGLNDAVYDVSAYSDNDNNEYRVLIVVAGAPDQFQVFKNGIAVGGATAITGAAQAIGDGLTIDFAYTTGHVIGDEWTLNIGKQDTFTWAVDNEVQANQVKITGANQITYQGVLVKFLNLMSHALGDEWTVELTPEINNGWFNFYQSLIRKPGEAYTLQLPSNFWTAAVQEDTLYVNTKYGQWLTLEFKLASNLLSEEVIAQPLKQNSQSRVIFPYMIGSVENNIIYVSSTKTVDMIGRKKFLELPQINTLSDLVKKDFSVASFKNGSIEFSDKKIWFNSAVDNTMFCYDWLKKYWQPPQVIPENGTLSVIEEDTLISHSYLRNQTNILFIGTNDNGFAYGVKMKFPFNGYGKRWQNKTYSSTFIEGYMQGNPQIIFRVIQDINGCHGVAEHTISPIVCLPRDNASLGKGSLGSHSLGNDPAENIPYFQEIYKQVPNDFFFGSIELECNSLDQRWGVLSVGLNAILSAKNNYSLVSNPINIV